MLNSRCQRPSMVRSRAADIRSALGHGCDKLIYFTNSSHVYVCENFRRWCQRPVAAIFDFNRSGKRSPPGMCPGGGGGCLGNEEVVLYLGT